MWGHTTETTSSLQNKQELECWSQVNEYQTAELPLEPVSVRQTSSGQNSNSLESSCIIRVLQEFTVSVKYSC